MVAMHGPRGGGFIFDTNAMHRIQMEGELPRRVVTLEFHPHGKELITIEHLLVHTAGIPYADVALWSAMHEWDMLIATICDAKMDEVPGTKAAYHPYSSWFILGEIVRRCDGRPFDRYAREEIFEPLGMSNCFLGMDQVRLSSPSWPPSSP